MRTLLCSALLAYALVAGGCASPGPAMDLGPVDSGNRCMPGSTKSCICLGGSEGTQTCRATGQSYGNCAGCGTQEADGPLPVARDAGGSPCGSCDGCCDGASCVAFASQTNTQCGGRGLACGSCGSNVCDTGTGMCVDASGGCSASSCSTGCCKMVGGAPTCFVDQPGACGTGGGTCIACSYGVLCNGACTTQIDSNAQFQVIVHSADFYNTTDTGACWDNYAGVGCAQPDPVVCFGYQSGGAIVEGCTRELNNVPADGNGLDHPTWDSTTGLLTVGSGNGCSSDIYTGGAPLLIPGSYFISGGKVRISVYDVDCTNSWDVIAQGYYTPVTMLADPMGVGAYGRVTHISFSLK